LGTTRIELNVQGMPLTEAIIQFVRAGRGLSIMASWAVREQLDAHTLVALPIRSKELRRQWSVTMLKDTATIPCVQAFVELLARFAPPENARHELGSSHRHDRKRRRGAKA